MKTNNHARSDFIYMIYLLIVTTKTLMSQPTIGKAYWTRDYCSLLKEVTTTLLQI